MSAPAGHVRPISVDPLPRHIPGRSPSCGDHRRSGARVPRRRVSRGGGRPGSVLRTSGAVNTKPSSVSRCGHDPDVADQLLGELTQSEPDQRCRRLEQARPVQCLGQRVGELGVGGRLRDGQVVRPAASAFSDAPLHHPEVVVQADHRHVLRCRRRAWPPAPATRPVRIGTKAPPPRSSTGDVRRKTVRTPASTAGWAARSQSSTSSPTKSSAGGESSVCGCVGALGAVPADRAGLDQDGRGSSRSASASARVRVGSIREELSTRAGPWSRAGRRSRPRTG